MKRKQFLPVIIVIFILSSLVSISFVNAQAGLTTTTNQRVNLRTEPSADAELSPTGTRRNSYQLRWS